MKARTRTLSAGAVATGPNMEEIGLRQPATPVSVEAESGRPLAARPTTRPRSPLAGFFGVYADHRTWGALAFIIISFVTGILYFTWAVTGLSLSVGLLILIIGLPFAFLFLLSVRGLGLVEASLVQALLDVRIQPQPMPFAPGSNLIQRARVLVSSGQTWRELLYLVLQLPLGVINFSVVTALLALALGIMAAPLAPLLGDVKVITINGIRLWLPFWGAALMEIIGFVLLTSAMHVIRAMGRWHGQHAASLLGG
jgi:Putative sensor